MSKESEDLRKDKKSHQLAKEAAKFILDPKNASGNDKVAKKVYEQLIKICSRNLHEGCYFSKKSGGEVFFEELDKDGKLIKGKDYNLEVWVQTTAKKLY